MFIKLVDVVGGRRVSWMQDYLPPGWVVEFVPGEWASGPEAIAVSRVFDDWIPAPDIIGEIWRCDVKGVFRLPIMLDICTPQYQCCGRQGIVQLSKDMTKFWNDIKAGHDLTQGAYPIVPVLGNGYMARRVKLVERLG